MNWIFTLVFTGLAVSSGYDVHEPARTPAEPAAPAAVRVQDPVQERMQQTYPLSANGRVSVSNVNGSITVEAWDRNEVQLEATKSAESKEALDRVEIKIDSRADSFSVKTDYETWRRDQGWKNMGNIKVEFRLSVPRTAILDEIETVNGSVNVSNFTRSTKVSAVNGDVTATDLRGAANLSTVNGAVKADFSSLEPGSKISLNTVNGSAELRIPSDANATIKADSLNGNITNDFGLSVRKGRFVGRDMHGRVGTGDVQIRLGSVNGPLSVLRKNDGRPVNPATDLLPQKGDNDDNDDNDDWDLDISSRVDNEKLNKDIGAAVTASNRAAAEGLKIAQSELVKIAPEIDKIRIDSLKGIEKLDKELIKVDKEKIKKVVEESMKEQKEMLERIRKIRWSSGNMLMDKKSNAFTVKGIPSVDVEAKGASVRVRGWARPDVKYVLTESTASRNRTPIDVAESVNGDSVALKVLNNERASRDMFFLGNTDSVRIEVFVPHRSNLKIRSNGEIRLEEIKGEIDLTGVDESIDVRDVEGKLKLTAMDGFVRVIGFNGELETQTVDGDVFIEGKFSKLTGKTENGAFVVTVPDTISADVFSNADVIATEDLADPERLGDGQWRFGSGGPKFDLNVGDGSVLFRGAAALADTK
ncbi:MAG: DUF4097 family beta strand repeat protein [Chloracidobacterium sp.]|nr:DUF4097 family beta strand repeat protein [Chloracidobacterium sp.]